MIVFSEEKFFTLDRQINTRNDRYVSREDAKDVDEAIKYLARTR